jgi:hypothetical protein
MWMRGGRYVVRTSSANGEAKTTERLSVNVSHLTAQTLRDLAEARSTTVTEVIRRAVAALKLLEDAWDEGAELQLVRPNDNTRWVIKPL